LALLHAAEAMSADDRVKPSGGGGVAVGGNESFYYAAVKRIMSGLSPSTLRQFHQLTSDDDRFAFVSALPDVLPALTGAVPRSRSPRCPSPRGPGDRGLQRGTAGRRSPSPRRTAVKSGEEAARLRQAGNELYKAERLHDALASYTASVLVAPVTAVNDHDEHEQASPARWNFNRCSSDSERMHRCCHLPNNCG